MSEVFILKEKCLYVDNIDFCINCNAINSTEHLCFLIYYDNKSKGFNEKFYCRTDIKMNKLQKIFSKDIINYLKKNYHDYIN